MKNWVRNSSGLTHFYWAIRAWLGRAPNSHQEMLHRIFRHGQHCGWEKPGTFHFPWGSFAHISAGKLMIQYEEIFYKRHYAFKTQVANPVIVDCGGNVGLSALWFKQTYPTCQLSVFEPDKTLSALIQKNLESAGIQGVQCLQKAAWIRAGQIGFDLRGDDRGKIVDGPAAQVEAVDLAAWLPASTELLKLDIEGAEFEVLNHLCTTGAIRRVNHLVCELHIIRGAESKLLQVLQNLMDSGMSISFNYGMASPGVGLAPDLSPFEVIGHNHFLIELYAWKKPAGETGASRAAVPGQGADASASLVS